MLNTDKIKYPVNNQMYEILDRVRRIRFNGRMIGKASTQREGGGPRWTDITIYVTEAGSYVIQREGVSLVYHRAESSCRGGELVRNEDILEDSVPCSVCQPPNIDGLDEIRETSDPYRNQIVLLERKLGKITPPELRELNYEYIARLEKELGIGQDEVKEAVEDAVSESRKSADPSRYRREVTMSSADIADDPRKIVPILTYQGRLTTVATDAIKAAIVNDPRVGGVFDQVETIA